jgi:hypothetical protein
MRAYQRGDNSVSFLLVPQMLLFLDVMLKTKLGRMMLNLMWKFCVSLLFVYHKCQILIIGPKEIDVYDKVQT